MKEELDENELVKMEFEHLRQMNSDLKKQIKENIRIVEKSREPDISDVNMEYLIVKRDLQEFKDRDKQCIYQEEIKSLEEKLNAAIGAPRALYSDLEEPEVESKYIIDHGQTYIH